MGVFSFIGNGVNSAQSLYHDCFLKNADHGDKFYSTIKANCKAVFPKVAKAKGQTPSTNGVDADELESKITNRENANILKPRKGFEMIRNPGPPDANIRPIEQKAEDLEGGPAPEQTNPREVPATLKFPGEPGYPFPGTQGTRFVPRVLQGPKIRGDLRPWLNVEPPERLPGDSSGTYPFGVYPVIGDVTAFM